MNLRSESEHQYNSPWNIVADFDINMSFSSAQISGMLEEYETDYHTGMEIHAVAEAIEQYTSGYPVLVSLICKYIDEKIAGSDGFEQPRQRRVSGKQSGEYWLQTSFLQSRHEGNQSGVYVWVCGEQKRKGVDCKPYLRDL